MEQQQSAICQICVGRQATGTGFLVAPDIVLTNYHVVQDLFKPPRDAQFSAVDVNVVFDVRDGQVRRDADRFKLAKEWKEDSSPCDRLDYALLRLDRKPNPARPWLKPLKYQFTPNEPLIIVQHPQGTGLKMAMGPFQQTTEDETRVAYLVNTEQGSSGSPCFTTDWQLVALHSRTDFKQPYNLGIPMSAIIAGSKFKWADVPASNPPANGNESSGSSTTEALAPAAVARFVLKKGVPVYSRQKNGWLLRLSLTPTPGDSDARVKHTLRDYWEEGDHERLTTNWNDGFEVPFTSYGDLSIVTETTINGEPLKSQTWLSDALRKGHAAEMTAAIQEAIEDLRQY